MAKTQWTSKKKKEERFVNKKYIDVIKEPQTIDSWKYKVLICYKIV